MLTFNAKPFPTLQPAMLSVFVLSMGTAYSTAPISATADTGIVGNAMVAGEATPQTATQAGTLDTTESKADQTDSQSGDAVVADVDPLIIATLDKLEHNSDGLTGFTARITFQTTDALLGRNETRTGSLIYDVRPDENARFAAIFNSEVIGRSKRIYEKHFVFDGRWLAEIDHKRKQFIKREVVAPGDDFDPLRLGEGPLALPIGQPRDEVLRRFSVKAIGRPQEGILERLPFDCIGLSLTPKPGTPEAAELERLDLFFDAATYLPLGSLMVENKNGDGESNTKTIMLRGIVRNPRLTKEQLARLDINEPDRALWAIDIRAWGDG